MPRYYKSSVELFNSILPKELYFLSKVPKIFGGIQQKYWYLFKSGIQFVSFFIQFYSKNSSIMNIIYNYKYKIMIMRHSNTCTCWKYVKRETNYIFFMIWNPYIYYLCMLSFLFNICFIEDILVCKLKFQWCAWFFHILVLFNKVFHFC